LRGQPARITRFRRDLIIAIAAGGSLAIAGVAWFALTPSSLHLGKATESASEPVRPSNEVLAGAPSGYGDVPQLGPPLPGDLGRPILRHRRSIDDDPAVPVAADSPADARVEEMRRLATDRQAARTSGVMMAVTGSRPASHTAQAAGMEVAATPEAGSTVAEPASPRTRPVAGVGEGGRAGINRHDLEDAMSPWTLHAGTVIAASLITGFESDLVGIVTAQVTEHVYDTVTGKTVLIPQGSRLVGRSGGATSFGQSRALILWQRIILPDGSSIRIDDVPVADAEGRSGLVDRVDRHGGQLLKGVALATLLGLGAELGQDDDESDLAEAIREAGQQSLSRAGDQYVSRAIDIRPTLRVRPGWPLRVIVREDLVLRPWKEVSHG
jgi:type IV secretion system protein VirB10